MSKQKSKAEKSIRVSISLPPACAEILRKLGAGNLSAGVRKSLELVQDEPRYAMLMLKVGEQK